MAMLKDITSISQRIYDGGEPKSVNCATCKHKVGRVCDYHHAVLQGNIHRPNNCEQWETKPPKGGL